MLSKYKAVFFDVGGTLLRVHPSVGEVYAAHARRYGFAGSAGDVDNQFRRQWKAVGGIESLGNQRGTEIEKKFWRDLVFRVFQPFGGLDNFEDYFNHIYEEFRTKSCWRVYEDVSDSEIFNRLKTRGVVLGVISNWDSRLPETLKAMGLARHFKFILVSTVVGSAKPDPRIFQEALRRSGVKANEACHIGDEPHTDISGARNAGIDAILIDRQGRHGNQVSPTVQSFTQLVQPAPQGVSQRERNYSGKRTLS
ncbi:MAG: HAD-IA family hydrolase [Nitrospinaceae bacterium]